MVNTVDCLKFISYNCKGFKNRNYNYLKELYDKNDILLLQETWLYFFQDDNVGKAGRPYGGCAIVWNNKLPIGVKPINTNSSKVCAAFAEIFNDKFIIISVYMPSNDNSIVNINEFEEILNEISTILSSNDDC